MYKQHGILLFSLLICTLLIAVSALVIVPVYLSTLNQKRQNLVDIAAVSAATQLDGKLDAITKATNIAKQILDQSGYVYDIYFYSYPGIETNSDIDATKVMISLHSMNIPTFFVNYLNALSGNSSSLLTSFSEAAIAVNTVCQVPPIFVCDNITDSKEKQLGVFVANIDDANINNIKEIFLNNKFAGCFPFVFQAKLLTLDEHSSLLNLLDKNKTSKMPIALADCSKIKDKNLVNTRGKYVSYDFKANTFVNETNKLNNYARLEY